MKKDKYINSSKSLWTDAQRPVTRLWIRSAEVRGEWEHNNKSHKSEKRNAENTYFEGRITITIILLFLYRKNYIQQLSSTDLFNYWTDARRPIPRL